MSRPNGKLVGRRVFFRAAFLAAISVLALSGFVEGANATVPTAITIFTALATSLFIIRNKKIRTVP